MSHYRLFYVPPDIENESWKHLRRIQVIDLPEMPTIAWRGITFDMDIMPPRMIINNVGLPEFYPGGSSPNLDMSPSFWRWFYRENYKLPKTWIDMHGDIRDENWKIILKGPEETIGALQ